MIVGYERVPDGGACVLCLTAAGQRYHSDDLMPIHDKCGCGVEPLTEDDLFHPKKGDKAELRSGKEYLPDGTWKPVEGTVQGRVARISDTQVMLNAGTDAKPWWVQGTRLDVRKPTIKERAKEAAKEKAKEKVKDEITGRVLDRAQDELGLPFQVVDVNTLDPLTPVIKGQKVRDHLVQPRDIFGDEERKAIRAYTGGQKKGAVAEDMNRSLRKGTFGDRSRHAEIRDGIDAAFERVDPVQEPALVFRGAKVKFANRLRPGAVIEDPGYMSTSPSRAVADGFAKFGSDIFEITMPKGTKAIDINEAAGSGYGFEREVLLPRGTKLVIESIRPDPKSRAGRRIIKARVIGHG